jgi:methyltransferase family protein
MLPYTSKFFEWLRPCSLASAREIVPLLLELIPNINSVIDIGCGDGTWLSVFTQFGVKETVGVDGAYVAPDELQFPASGFICHDLATRFHSERRYDLVLCLEVAEHLPAQSAADLVEGLTMLGDMVVFSAAVPGQEGTEHVNPQFPEYWAKLFGQHHFAPVDCIRRRVWNNPNVCYWYAQNTIVYVKQNTLAQYPKLQADVTVTPLAMIHPCLFERVQRRGPSVRRDFKELVNSIKAALSNRCRRLTSRALRKADTV